MVTNGTNEVVLAGAVRTPIGTFSGAFVDTPATTLGSIVIAEALKRANVSPDQVDEVIMGNVLSAGLGMNPARQASIAAGIPETVPCTSVNKVCGSGLKTVALATQAVLLGDADIVVAGGMENMSASPFLLPKGRYGYKMGHGEIIDHMIRDGLWCALGDCHMGITAENVAGDFEISRADQDEFSAASQQKTAQAWEAGRFADEVVPVEVKKRKETISVDKDEHFRAGTTAEVLGKLRPAFQADGSVTAGNASGINDGAAAVVVMSRKKAEELGVAPMATVTSYASAGVAPRVMGIGPVPATQKALARSGLSIGDMDLIEANEAFAAQSLAVGRELGWDWERVNVNGGAIALGHPIGASGTRILVTLLHEMKRREAKRGLATLCIGGGQGIAMVVENAN
ncbi:MAG: acetyl-CoA C-acyltransferase [Chloroflexi bacterium]|nr:MAG: acetyl-CoA C-acyltransferase [Chloroflexota bacterium]